MTALPTPPALDEARRDNAPKCGCGAEFPTIGELRAHIAGFYQSARHWEAPMSTDSMMLEVWAQWADKDGNRGAAALFRRVRAALEAGSADTRDASEEELRTLRDAATMLYQVDGYANRVSDGDPTPFASLEFAGCLSLAEELEALAAARSPLTETTDG